MATTEQDIDSFAQFAKQKLAQAEGELSMDDIYDEWRIQHPPSEDALAIKAALRDMHNGERGQPFDEFVQEFRARKSSAAES